MSGYGTRVNETWTDRLAGELPKVSYSPRLMAGSLVLLDPNYPGSEWPAGAPANGVSASDPVSTWILPNAARSTASALGVTVDTITPRVLLSAEGTRARTVKGAVRIKQASNDAAYNVRGFSVVAPASVYDYMRANPTHQFGLSQWINRTEAAAADVATSEFRGLVNGVAIATSASGTVGTGGATTVLRSGDPSNTLGAQCVAVVTTGYAAAFTAYAWAWDRASLFKVSGQAWNDTPARRAQGGTVNWYGVSFIDLTVAGMAATDWAAIETTEFNKAFATGGAFAGDTWT